MQVEDPIDEGQVTPGIMLGMGGEQLDRMPQGRRSKAGACFRLLLADRRE